MNARSTLCRIAPLCLAAGLPLATASAWTQSSRPAAAESRPTDERQPVEVVRVISGDTIQVRRKGHNEVVHLLSVDTEEPLGLREASSTKPQTAFGEECFQWLRASFRGMADENGITSVTLVFPDDVEQRDYFGRLLCHVLLPDGTDLNLQLVREGRSPYYNKYGSSEICHDDFVAAQAAARKATLGIWNPKTNEGGAERRAYSELLPWWNARAAAIDDFRERSAKEPGHVIAAQDPDALLKAAAAEQEVEIFGEISRALTESSGDLSILMRSADRKRALRISVPKDTLEGYAALEIDKRQGTYRQNFFYVRGLVTETERGFLMVPKNAKSWSLAGPEPVMDGE